MTKGAAKKIKVFFSGPATKAPPPLELSGHIFGGNFFQSFKKKLFFLSGQALNSPPSLLVAGPKTTFIFFAASLNQSVKLGLLLKDQPCNV